MDISLWIKQHKALAAVGGGGALLFMMHRGHSASGSGSVANTSGDVGPATNTEVQLVPVSTSPAEQAGGNLDVPNPSDPNIPAGGDLTAGGGIPYPISVGGDINSPLVGTGAPPASDPATSEQEPTTPVNGVAQNGNASTAAAVAAATRPHGHPGYKTVVERSKKSPTHREVHHVYRNREGKVTRDVAVKPAPALPKVKVTKSEPRPKPVERPHPVESRRRKRR